MQKGKFITVEGVEGAGKSTNIATIKSFLDQSGIEYIHTREPGGTEYGERLRELLLAHLDETLDPTAELLMIFAARAQHLSQLILPALARGVWVLSDRFTDATYAYQGAGRALDLDTISTLEHLVQGDLRPDLTLILDLPVALGMQRVNGRGERDRFEVEQNAFFERVRASYLSIAAQSPERYRLIDTSKPLDQVRHDIVTVMGTYCDEHQNDG